jgi:hypothetical protein
MCTVFYLWCAFIYLDKILENIPHFGTIKLCLDVEIVSLQEVCLFVQLCNTALRLTVRSWLDIPTFATRCHHARAPSGRKWNCGREMSGNFAEMKTSMPFRELLYAVKLRHETGSFTSPSKEGVLRSFSP